MGTYMDKLKPKEWWRQLDSIPITDYDASTLNTSTYISDEYYHYNTIHTTYRQFTQTNGNQYYWIASERNNLEEDMYDVFQINEFAWQNIEKTEGGIERYYDPLDWKYRSDSLIVEIQSFNTSKKLSLSLSDYAGSLVQYDNDSIYIYKWNGIGKGSYLVKHAVTGLSINQEVFW
jgi:hypothetical protein